MKHFKTFPVTEKKNKELHARMEKIGLWEDDIRESFVHGGGKGGQKLNKTASCVVLTHIPSGEVVRSQKERSREMNRFFARRLLCEHLEIQKEGHACAKNREIEKIRKRKKAKAKKTAKKYACNPADETLF